MSQWVEEILNKIAKAFNKIFAGLKFKFQGFRVKVFDMKS